MKKYLKTVSKFFSGSLFKTFALIIAVMLPLIFSFQNCAKMKYEDPNSILTDNINNNDLLGTVPEITGTIGSFAALGVTGDFDSNIDSFLFDGLIPTFHWSQSVNAASYTVKVYNGSQLLCSMNNITELNVKMQDCGLVFDNNYDLQIIAIGDASHYEAQIFPFKTQENNIGLAIDTPRINQRNVILPIALENQNLVTKLECTLIFKKTAAIIFKDDCANGGISGIVNLTEKAYSNLTYGDYLFRVTATKNSGNEITKEKEFSILSPNCDPLNRNISNSVCEKRLFANVYFKDATKNSLTTWKKSLDFINHGISSGYVYLSQVFMPTRAANLTITESHNGKTPFALDIQSLLKTSDKMPVGNYQIALLSDDGSSLYVASKNGMELIISNEGDHPTKLACSQKPLALSEKEKIYFRLTYYQGPQSAISLVMLYRPWDEKQKDICPSTTDNNYFGPFPVPLDKTNWSGTRFQQLLDAGWKVVPPESFEMPSK